MFEAGNAAVVGRRAALFAARPTSHGVPRRDSRKPTTAPLVTRTIQAMSAIDLSPPARALPGWVTEPAFVAASLGALAMLGHAAGAAQYLLPERPKR
jgi:hypothetical protein